MRRMMALLFAGLVGAATLPSADAQFSLQIGNPYGGGISIGNGVYGYPGYNSYYGSPYGYGYGVPATTYYSSGYVAPGYVAAVPRVYSSPAYGYSSYGYRSYGFRNYGYGGFGRRGYGYGRGWGRGGLFR